MIIDSPVISGSLAASFRNVAVTGSLGVTGSITTTGTITAQTLVVQTVTSSIVYSSGSNVFGNNINNTQVFTGSMSVSGSGTFVNSITASAISINPSGPGFAVLGASTSYGSVSSGGGGATLYLNGATRGGSLTAASNAATIATDGNIYFANAASNSYKMFISASGNVGIGTTNPSFGKLQITTDSQDELVLTTATNANQQLVLGYNLSGNYGRIQSVNQGTSYTNLALQKDGGYVGIGTSTPEGPLHVYGSIGSGYIGMVITNYAGGAGATAGIDFGADGSTAYNGAGNGQITVVNTGGTPTGEKSEMNFKIWNGSSLVTGIKISDAGKVTFPTATSMANGVSSATAITVNTSTFTTVASVTITTTGKSVLIVGTGDMNPVGGPTWFLHSIFRDGTEISHRVLAESAAASMNVPFAVCHIDTPSAGSHTYTIRVSQGGGYAATYGETGDIQAPTIFATEVL